jgi:pyruvate,water dikinase
MMNVGNPELAFEFRRLPNEVWAWRGWNSSSTATSGSIPRRCSSSINNRRFEARDRGANRGYASPTEYYISKIVEGIATIAAAFWPKKVIVRLSDFKSNEYSNLLGGSRYEPDEENPMLGFRGASRYIAPEFHDCFALECSAMKRVRDDMGFTNVELMIPFVRTITEAEKVIALLKEQGSNAERTRSA